MHVWLCNVLDHNRDVEVPSTDRLVIGSRHKSPVFIDKSDSVDRSQMLIILLSDLTAIDIILT